MRHGQSQECDRPAERGNDGSEEARGQNDEHTALPDIDTQVFGVAFAEKQKVQGLEQQERGDGAGHNSDGEEGQLGFAHI